MKTNKPRVIFITHDSPSKIFDRRITDQARTLKDSGCEVEIFALSERPTFIYSNSSCIVGISGPLEEVKFQSFYRFITIEAKSKQEKGSTTHARPDLDNELPHQELRVWLINRILHLATKLKPHYKKLPLYIRARTTRSLVTIFDNLTHIANQSAQKNQFSTVQTDTLIPSWIREAARIFYFIEDTESDLYVACDLPAAIACLVKFNLDQSRFWFDAHEIFSQQEYIRKKGSIDLLESLERLSIETAWRFSTVNELALNQMANQASRIGPSFCFSNVPKYSSSSKFKVASHSKTFDIVFHGGLSSGRSVFEFALPLTAIDSIDWTLSLFGWDVDDRLVKLAKKDSRIRIKEPFRSDESLAVLEQFHCVVLPYKVVDDNTKFAMPNKMGDAIVCHKKVLFNSDLVEVSRLNQKLKFGADYTYGQTVEQTSDSIKRALLALLSLQTDWEKVDKDLGYENNEKKIKELVEDLRMELTKLPN